MKPKNKLSQSPQISVVASQWLERINTPSNRFIEASLTNQAALDAVHRIMTYGRNESGDKLQDTLWFRQQLRLTADNRIKHLLTTGASQVSKSLANYLDCVDTLINGQVSIGWFYASCSSMQKQQPQQFQKIANAWINNLPKVTLAVERDSITRFSIAKATGNFTYATSANLSKSGGATEGKEAASFSASKLYLEEKSNWGSNVDVSPRLGASRLPSKPIREIGTPGSGSGIERLMKEALHIFCPGLICKKCKQLTWLEPKGALLKPSIDEKTKKQKWFNARGEIIDFYSHNGDAKTAYIACIHCENEIKSDEIENCQLYSKQTKQSADDFLQGVGDENIVSEPIAIYLSPLLRVPSDPYRLQELITDGLDPQNTSIYQQNKLGYPSETGVIAITIADYEHVYNLGAYRDLIKPKRFIGIDQGRDQHWATVIEVDFYQNKKQIIYAFPLTNSDILPVMEKYNVIYGCIDNEPDRLSAYDLVEKSNKRLVLADQRSIADDYKEIIVRHGAIELPAYAISNNVYCQLILNEFIEANYRINCVPHRKFAKQVTSVRRNYDTGLFERPTDHDDHLFFSLLFAEAAIAIYRGTFKPPSASSTVGKPLKQLNASSTPSRGIQIPSRARRQGY